MKTRQIQALVLCIFIAGGIKAEETKMETLALATGKTYARVTVREIRPDGISIIHDGGVARIPYEQLPKEMIEKLGPFDAEKASQARLDDAKKLHATNQQLAAEDRQARIHELEKESARLDAEMSKSAVIRVIQALDGGALCRIRLSTETTQHKTVKDAFGRTQKIPYKVEGMSLYSQEMVYIEGLTGVIDEQVTSGYVIPLSKPYIYNDTRGARATVKAYRLYSGAAKN